MLASIYFHSAKTWIYELLINSIYITSRFIPKKMETLGGNFDCQIHLQMSLFLGRVKHRGFQYNYTKRMYSCSVPSTIPGYSNTKVLSVLFLFICQYRTSRGDADPPLKRILREHEDTNSTTGTMVMLQHCCPACTMKWGVVHMYG